MSDQAPKEKARIRVPARRQAEVGAFQQPGKAWTEDSFQNVGAALGYGTNNVSSGASYGFSAISRNHIQLAFMYRGSWLPRKVVDQVADDMTRAGLEIESEDKPEEIAEIHELWRELKLWDQLRDTIKWARLYGGALAVMIIDGQRPDAPLDLSTIGKGAFKGVMVFDRWVAFPVAGRLIQDLGPNFGQPEYYETHGSDGVPGMRIHHSRCIRFEGDPLPYWQKIVELGWGASVLEQLYDRMIAFDAATAGAAQLIYKAHLRTYKVANLRALLAAGEKMRQAFYEQVYLVRQMQTNEGLTVIDAEDSIEHHTSSAMSGISDALSRFGEQLSGATGIPLVVLFGQSPSGFSTGETDVRNYYDRISSRQQSELEEPVRRLLTACYWSKFGRAPAEGWSFSFNSLWQMSAEGKANLAKTLTDIVASAHGEGLISDQVALKELKGMARETGAFSNIRDEDIEAADDQLPDPDEGEDMPPDPGAMMGHNGGPPLDAGDKPILEAPRAGKPPRPILAPPKAPTPPAAEKSQGDFEVTKTKDGMRAVKGIPGVRLKVHPSIIARMKTNRKG